MAAGDGSATQDYMARVRRAVMDNMMIAKIRYWLVKRICRRYARGYIHVADRMGLEWTMALIDEDVEMHGHAFNHALARAGVIDYAERTGQG